MTNYDSTVLGREHYWLVNAHIPTALLVNHSLTGHGDVAHVDLEIKGGIITQIVPSGSLVIAPMPAMDMQQSQVWCCFVDIHTHLDKGHIWSRSPNISGTFDNALEAVCIDREKHWNEEDVYRRMEFGLKCSYAHGTRAIRTHIDAMGAQAVISLEVFKTLRQEWRDRLTLQAVCLVPLEYFQSRDGQYLADQMADIDGVLGGLPTITPHLDTILDRVFALATERHLALDFHTDESGDPDDITLRHVAAATLRHPSSRQVVCGHCCSLAVQPAQEVLKTLELLKQARIGIVSLPMCNLFLQDRNQSVSSRWIAEFSHLFPSHTPRWRGITLVHELKHYGIPVAFASDNCRDPFYGYGDHDVLEVFTQSTRIAQLDATSQDWCQSVTTIPADLMNLPTLGRIGVGLPADLILFKARHHHELLSRPQGDRIVLRNGKPIDTSLPDYRELDDLL